MTIIQVLFLAVCLLFVVSVSVFLRVESERRKVDRALVRINHVFETQLAFNSEVFVQLSDLSEKKAK